MLRNRWPECFGMAGRNRPATSGRIGAENALSLDLPQDGEFIEL